jgi:hypothetical protein
MSAIVRETDTVWHATLRGLLRSAQRDGAVDRSLEPNDAAAVIVATLKGTYLLPAGAGQPERVSQALRQLERWLSL